MEVKQFLSDNHLVDEGGKLNDDGWKLFSRLLDFVGPYPNLTDGIIPSPYGIFDKLLSRVVPTAQELFLVRDGQIYMTYRDDKNWKGWHTPGGFLQPGETLIMAAQRIADTEVPGIKITGVKQIGGGALRATDNPRFDCTVILGLAEFEGEPTNGQWFDKFPENFLGGPQSTYPDILAPYLKA